VSRERLKLGTFGRTRTLASRRSISADQRSTRKPFGQQKISRLPVNGNLLISFSCQQAIRPSVHGDTAVGTHADVVYNAVRQ